LEPAERRTAKVIQPGFFTRVELGLQSLVHPFLHVVAELLVADLHAGRSEFNVAKRFGSRRQALAILGLPLFDERDPSVRPGGVLIAVRFRQTGEPLPFERVPNGLEPIRSGGGAVDPLPIVYRQAREPAGVTM